MTPLRFGGRFGTSGANLFLALPHHLRAGVCDCNFLGSFGLGLSTTTTSERLDLSPGANTYLFRVRAVDKAGNMGAYKLGPGFKVNAFQESSTAIVDTGFWNTATLI